MQESITMAVVGSIVKVSGSRMATPFGPPSPGNTPTKMPSTSPMIIKTSVLNVSRTLKPWSRRPNASIALVTEECCERPLRHDHVEGDVEGDEHDEREQQAREQRLPQRHAADDPHEAGDQQEARDVEAEPLHGQAVQHGRDEHLQHTAELVAVDEAAFRRGLRAQLEEQAEQAGGAEDQ